MTANSIRSKAIWALPADDIHAPRETIMTARDISKDLLKQVERVLDSGYSTLVEDCE